MDRLLDRPIKAAAIETPLDQFAYWLERDWPRTQELKWLTLSQDNIPDTNPLYERRWVTRVRNSWPVLIITAESMTPGRVVVAWVEWARSTYTDIPHPVEAMAGWVRFRFRVEAEDPNEDAQATAARLVEPMPLLPGRATSEQWYAWFDWYYRQPWGPEELSARLRHMAQLTGKSPSQTETMHAQYMAAKR